MNSPHSHRCHRLDCPRCGHQPRRAGRRTRFGPPHALLALIQLVSAIINLFHEP